MKKLYLGNLPYSAGEEEITDFLKSVAEEGEEINIISIYIPQGDRKGFAFAEIEDDAIADRMIETLNGQDFGGRNAIVNEARPKEEGGRRPFSGGGNRFGGGGGGGRRFDGGNRGGGRFDDRQAA